MKKFLLSFIAIFAISSLAYAQAPHSLKATANYNAVTLNWESPESTIKLQWHDDYDYDGNDGVAADLEQPVTFYVSSYFTADDLKNVVGKSVEAISYMQYRAIYQATVILYENEKIVAQKEADQSLFEQGEYMKVNFDEPYVIKEGVNLRFAVKYVSGHNMDFVANKDAGPTVYGKGDCISNDGKTWTNTGNGNFLITATLVNNHTTAPDGFNVYCDGTKVNSEPVTETSYTLTEQTTGSHNYAVSAIYGSEEQMSYTTPAVVNSFPTPRFTKAETGVLNTTLQWKAPLTAVDKLTWSNETVQTGIGGTSSSDPKIWIKNEFDPSDLIAYTGGQITAINLHLYKEETSCSISEAVLFIFEDDVMVYDQALTQLELNRLAFDSWNKITLSTPYSITAGKKVAYGVFLRHTKKTHPVSVDTGGSVNNKGNMYSTSSPKSTFDNSKPYWSSIAEGNVSGNWMMTADITSSFAETLAGYDLYRNGEKIASDINTDSYIDNVEAPGYYTYEVVAKGSNGNISSADNTTVYIELPEVYRAPYVETSKFDETTKEISASWSMDMNLTNAGDPIYITGFTGDMNLTYGSKLSADLLKTYSGYSISRIYGMIGEETGEIKVAIYTPTGTVLAEKTLAANTIEPLTTFYVELDNPVSITGEEDLYVAYTANLKANTTPIVVDEGSLVDGGAMVSFTPTAGASTWMALGTILSNANDYNIYIGALATPPTATPSSKTSAKSYILSSLPTKDIEVTAIQPKSAIDNNPVVSSFNIYKNNVLVAQTNEYNYAETLKSFGTFNYEISAVYKNGWESPRTNIISFNNTIVQKNPAPFDLTGAVSNNDLVLTWSNPSSATILTYEIGTNDNAMQLTGSGDGFYAITKYKVEDLADKVGMKISHIKFKLASTEVNSLYATVMYGDNVVYKQPIDTKSIVVGYNTVRLDNPVEIPANWEVGVGYIINGATGTPLMVMDEGPAVEGYGDYYSSSGSYWYSMKKKNKLDYNWRISAILEKADQNLIKPMSTEASSCTYNVYRDNELIATGLTETTYTVENAADGSYTVTAVTEEVETAESNAVNYSSTSAIDNVEINYNTDIEYYNMQGIKIEKPENGIYIMKQGAKAVKIVK